MLTFLPPLCPSVLHVERLLLTSPLSPQPGWPTLEGRGRLQSASGRAFASGCSYRTSPPSSERFSHSRGGPPSLRLPSQLNGDVQKLLPRFFFWFFVVVFFFFCTSRSFRPPLWVTSRLLIPLWTMKKHTKVHVYRELRSGGGGGGGGRDSEGTLSHVPSSHIITWHLQYVRTPWSRAGSTGPSIPCSAQTS